MSTEMTTSFGVMMALGAFHGLNPGMGWLFAVALGMQERHRGAVLRALAPLFAGHALAVTSTVAVALTIGAVIPLSWLRWPVAGALVWLGVSRLRRHRHPRVAGMRVSMSRLALWSFLMATAHGAGLMVLPLFMSTPQQIEHQHHVVDTVPRAGTALLATGVHAVGYLAVTAFMAMLVFEKLGVGILRRAWINLDVVWAAALMTTGVLTVIL